MSNAKKIAIVLIVGVFIWFIPCPSGLGIKAWHLFAIVVATILGLILQPLPIGAVAFIGVTVTILTKTMSVGDSLKGFGSSTIWLIVSAYMIA